MENSNLSQLQEKDGQENSIKNSDTSDQGERPNESLLKYLLTRGEHKNICAIAPSPSQLMKEQLYPSSPIIHLSDRNEAFEPWVEEFCWEYPIVVIRSLTKIVHLNNELFYPKSIAAKNPKDEVEIRTQMQQISVENWDKTYSKNIWNCYSHRSYMTFEKFNKYYSLKYDQSAKEAKTYMENDPTASKNLQNIIQIVEKSKRGKIHFATNLDLSNTRKWKPQLRELEKLPPFLQVNSKKNMLNYVNHKILGINTAQLYMKVPGSRLTGHQENNNFSLVNINLGPGHCEWFVVPYEYWGVLFSLCKRNGVDFLTGSWWPANLDELYEKNIPIYRCIQKEGDVVWVNAGCVHWVQAIGYCTNVAWNVGPFTAKQYKLAIQSYEWYKLQSFRSIVPIIHLSWNLARKNCISDPGLYRLIKESIQQSLEKCNLILKFVQDKSLELCEPYSQKKKTHYCYKCQIELFNILLINKQKNKHVSYCLECVLNHSSSLEGFSYLEQYDMEELMKICDNFTLNQSKSVLPF